jgi:RNA polymerase sigma factor (sigma-70 family)
VPALESDLDHERRLELLRLALAELPASKRTLLELFYMRGHSVAEIATQQGRSVSAVKMQLSRSRQTLSRIFQSMLNRKSPPRQL